MGPMRIGDKLFLIGELMRGARASRFRLLSEEFLWNELLKGAYEGSKRELVMSYVLAESARNAKGSGPRGERCQRLLRMLLERYGGELLLTRLNVSERAELRNWPGLSEFPVVKQRLDGLP